MPKAAKKKFNPSVRNSLTFGKKKIKPGKQLRRENATNTKFQAKKITLVEQIGLNENEPQQQKGQTNTADCEIKNKEFGQRSLKNLAELGPLLGHYNENLCRDAILGVRSHFNYSPELVRKQLRLIIPGVGALLIRELKQTATRNQLKKLLEQICELPVELMRSHFPLFCQFVLTGISDIRPVVRGLAVGVLFLLLKKYPELCAKSEDIFNKYLQLFNNQRLPADNRLKMLDSINQFISVFRPTSKSTALLTCQEFNISFPSSDPSPSIQILPSPAVFHFPVLYADNYAARSPMERADGIVTCCQTLCAFLTATIHEDEMDMKSKLNATITRVFNAVSLLAGAVLEFLEKRTVLESNDHQIQKCLADAFAPLKKCPAIEGSKKLMQKLEAIAAQK